RIALSFEGAQEGSHMGAADFRVGGRIFATLASQKEGYGNLMLTPEQQAEFVRELPEVFLPIRGGKDGDDPHSPRASKRGRAGWRSACGKDVQTRKECRDKKESCFEGRSALRNGCRVGCSRRQMLPRAGGSP